MERAIFRFLEDGVFGIRTYRSYQRCYAGVVSLQNLTGQAACLVGMAQCPLAEKDVQEAVTLCALANNYRREKNLKFQEPDEVAFEAVLKQGKKKLGGARFESAYNHGETIEIEETLLRLMK